jgi:hypothetical protein
MASGWYRVGVFHQPVRMKSPGSYRRQMRLPFDSGGYRGRLPGCGDSLRNVVPDGSLAPALCSQSRTLYANDDLTVLLPLEAIRWHGLLAVVFIQSFYPGPDFFP